MLRNVQGAQLRVELTCADRAASVCTPSKALYTETRLYLHTQPHTDMLRTCNLVGRHFYTSVILTPDDSIRLVHEPTNPKDANAHQVWALVENEWQHVGYVDRGAAEYLVNRKVASALNESVFSRGDRRSKMSSSSFILSVIFSNITFNLIYLFLNQEMWPAEIQAFDLPYRITMDFDKIDAALDLLEINELTALQRTRSNSRTTRAPPAAPRQRLVAQ